jgi:hypothetical protein
VAEVAERPLDFERPLWEMHVVEGLESGHFAIITKIHHPFSTWDPIPASSPPRIIRGRQALFPPKSTW